jgi:hypothetical protein
MRFSKSIYFLYFPAAFPNNFVLQVSHQHSINSIAEEHSEQTLFAYPIIFYIFMMEFPYYYCFHSNFMSIFWLFPEFLAQIGKFFYLVTLDQLKHHLQIYLKAFKYHLSFIMFIFTLPPILISKFPFLILNFLKFHIFFLNQKTYHFLDFFNSELYFFEFLIS